MKRRLIARVGSMVGPMVGVLVGSTMLGGCYERVVRVSGGAAPDNRVIHEAGMDPKERIPVLDDVADTLLGPGR